MMLLDVCLPVCLTSVYLTSVAYIGPKSRTEMLKKTKIGTEVAHVTRDLDTTFKVKRSKVKVTRPLYSPRR